MQDNFSQRRRNTNTKLAVILCIFTYDQIDNVTVTKIRQRVDKKLDAVL